VSQNGSAPAQTPAQAASLPFFGIFGDYKAARGGRAECAPPAPARMPAAAGGEGRVMSSCVPSTCADRQQHCKLPVPSKHTTPHTRTHAQTRPLEDEHARV
jgi:hypothetical protein